ncbi:MAG TPA: phosphate signaling complex protein PhoU [Anaeromyxobacteraceae bacterium]|nr:phosphate signaling complex protein PhoU [Anaeromyxobacteraceae bacterium]
MAPEKHTDKVYEAELALLRDRLLDMGGMVESAIAGSIRALTGRDQALAEKVIAGDKDVNRAEVEIDEMCRRLLALRQPAASDLRFITTALKIVTDLERMGDLAVNVAERAVDLSQSAPTRPFHDLDELAELSGTQLGKALDAFVERDAVKAQEVIDGDDLLDAIYHRLFNELLAYMMEDSRVIRRATAVMFAAKQLERFGDHATNVAEMVVYMVRGTDVRHHGKLPGEGGTPPAA